MPTSHFAVSDPATTDVHNQYRPAVAVRDPAVPIVGVRAVVHPSDPYEPTHVPDVKDDPVVAIVPSAVRRNPGAVPVGSDEQYRPTSRDSTVGANSSTTLVRVFIGPALSTQTGASDT